MEKKTKKIVKELGFRQSFVRQSFEGMKIERKRIFFEKPYSKKEIEGIKISIYHSSHFHFIELGYVISFKFNKESELDILIEKKKEIFDWIHSQIRIHKIEITHILFSIKGEKESYHISQVYKTVHSHWI